MSKKRSGHSQNQVHYIAECYKIIYQGTSLARNGVAVAINQKLRDSVAA